MLERWRRDPDGWRGLVRYTEAPGLSYLNWQPADRLRLAPSLCSDWTSSDTAEE